MDITFTAGTGFSSIPTADMAAFNTAAAILDNAITDNITVNLTLNWTGTGGGASATPGTVYGESYSTVYTYLTTHASPGDTSFSNLPNSSSIGGASTVWMSGAELLLMGGTPNAGPVGEATFATDIQTSLLVGVALHEFAHALGRVPFVDGSGNPDIFNLFRFTSSGNYYFNDNAPGSTVQSSYFSLNGGLSDWADYGRFSDPSDFLNSYQATNGGNGLTDAASPLTPEDAFDQYYDGSTLQALTPADLEQLDVLGFHLKYDAPADNAYDFAGDGNGDLLLQSGGGQIEYANILDGTFKGFKTVANTPGYTVDGEGKISGGASSDVVIQSSNGLILYGDLVGGSFSQWVRVGNTPGYNVVGVGDINDDHYDDVVIQNPDTGVIDYANMQNGVFHSWVHVSNVPGFSVRGVGDVNFDGYADIVIENSSGAIDYANMNGGTFNGWLPVANAGGFNVVGVGDINRDGYADIVVQNPTNGEILYANMDKGTFSGWVRVANAPGWNVTAVEDLLGNGFDDIVIQNSTTAQVDFANMTAGQFNGWEAVTSTPGFVSHMGPSDQQSVQPSSLSLAPVGIASLPTPATLQPALNFGTVA